MKGKTALITGAATGIGRAIALRLAQEGVNIVINYSRSEEDAKQTQKEVEALGVQTLLYQANVAKDHEVREMVEATINRFQRIDILVNNAGVTDFVKHSNLDALTEESWDRVMDVNVKGTFFCCRAAAEELKKQEGCIVNIASVAGLTGLGSSIAYAASKAANLSVMKSLARVMAPEVRVNSISPGYVHTRWWADEDSGHASRVADRTPLGRASVPEDVAEVAYSLIASASFVTGQNVVVDGGMFI
jgi:3-oxoacyl-[acyl-carrier protein] reductase